MLSFKMLILKKGSPILEELNKTPGEYVGFNTLQDITKLKTPTLSKIMRHLGVSGYIEKRVTEDPEPKVEYKIVEKGQDALAKYKEMEKIMEQIP